MSHTFWRADEPSTHYQSQRIRESMKPQRTHLILSVLVMGGPKHGLKASVRADEHRNPPPVLETMTDSRAVYRYSFDRKAYVWWEAPPGTPVPSGIPFKQARD